MFQRVSSLLRWNLPNVLMKTILVFGNTVKQPNTSEAMLCSEVKSQGIVSTNCRLWYFGFF